MHRIPNTPRRRALALVVVTLLGTPALAACGGSSSSSSADGSATSGSATSSSAAPGSAAPSGSGGGATSSSPTAQAQITIEDFAYTTPSSVQPGQGVMVTNDDSEAHTVTADEGGAFGVTVAPGKTVMLTAPTKPGRYAFHCEYHSNMHGTLVVR